MEIDPDNPYRPPTAAVADIVDTFDSPEMELATRWQRFFGELIDIVVMAAIGIPAMYFFGLLGSGASRYGTLREHWISFSSGLLLNILLNGYLLHKYGQTIGKRFVGTRIVTAKGVQVLPLWKVIVFRELPWEVTVFLPFNIGLWMDAFDALFIFRNDRRCLHDLIASTRVIAANVPWKDQRGDAGVQ